MSSSSLRIVLVPALFASVAACATLPEVGPWVEPAGRSRPTIVGARGPLKPAQIAAVIARLQAKGPSDLLARHIAIEEEVAGRPLTVGNEATVLVDGPASYEAMFAAIERARDHVNAEFYIIDNDEAGRRFGDALLRKSAQGVAVSLIYDSVGCRLTPASFFARLRRGGVNVLEYNPVNPLKARSGWRLNNRNHRKAVIVDGRVAFTGGINISGVYGSASGSSALRGSAGSGPGSGPGPRMGSAPRALRTIGWRDTNIRIEGPAVAQLQQLFLDTWQKQRGTALPQREWFPAMKPQGRHPVRILASGPRDDVPAIYVTLLSAIGHAQKSVRITMAYFVPDPQTIKALKDAAARGVEVTLLLPSITDFWAVFHAGRSHYADLLAAGVKIYERQEAVLHAKTVVIDGVWSMVGSSNMDWRSFLHNEELNAIVLGYEVGSQMEAMFQRDLAGSARIDAQAWARRPLQLRLREWVARAWEYWL